MNCLKCGREIQEGHVFCPDCLEVMSAHPIAPGTPVKILPRPPKVQEKKAKTLPPAVQIRQLKKRNRRLSVIVIAMLVLVVLLSGLLVQQKAAAQKPPIGRNYTVLPR